MRFREKFTPSIAVLGTCLVVALACGLWPGTPGSVQAKSGNADADYTVRSGGEPILPLAAPTGLDLRKVALGKRLFHDPQLSKDDTISCASCHSLQTAGVDRRARSRGIQQREGKRNAPTVFNAALNYRQFWDGRAVSLEAQMDGPLQTDVEMGSNWADVAAKLRKDHGYVTAFAALYADGIQEHNIKDAIATFERSLITPDAPFDRFLHGDRSAISAQAAKGYELFKSYGCISCHQGANVGGNLMQPFGVVLDPATIRAQALHKDLRLLRATDIKADRNRTNVAFRVPSLRNVARTAPYFDDGSAQNLPDAVSTMGFSQLGRRLPDPDVAAIVAFLESLTGKYEGKSL